MCRADIYGDESETDRNREIEKESERYTQAHSRERYLFEIVTLRSPSVISSS